MYIRFNTQVFSKIHSCTKYTILIFVLYQENTFPLLQSRWNTRNTISSKPSFSYSKRRWHRHFQQFKVPGERALFIYAVTLVPSFDKLRREISPTNRANHQQAETHTERVIYASYSRDFIANRCQF